MDARDGASRPGRGRQGNLGGPARGPLRRTAHRHRRHISEQRGSGHPARPGGQTVPGRRGTRARRIVIDIISERLAEPDCRHGFVLDGFPRSAPQASALSRRLDELGTPLDAAISLAVQEEELFQRLAARARADDTEQTIRNRLRVFAASNHPLLRYYEQRGLLARIDGVGDPDDLTALVAARLKGPMAPPLAERPRSVVVALPSMVGR